MSDIINILENSDIYARQDFKDIRRKKRRDSLFPFPLGEIKQFNKKDYNKEALKQSEIDYLLDEFLTVARKGRYLVKARNFIKNPDFLSLLPTFRNKDNSKNSKKLINLMRKEGYISERDVAKFIKIWRDHFYENQETLNYYIGNNWEDFSAIGFTEVDWNSCFRSKGFHERTPKYLYDHASRNPNIHPFAMWITQNPIMPIETKYGELSNVIYNDGNKIKSTFDLSKVVCRCWGFINLNTDSILITNKYPGSSQFTSVIVRAIEQASDSGVKSYCHIDYDLNEEEHYINSKMYFNGDFYEIAPYGTKYNKYADHIFTKYGLNDDGDYTCDGYHCIDCDNGGNERIDNYHLCDDCRYDGQYALRKIKLDIGKAEKNERIRNIINSSDFGRILGEAFNAN